MDEELALLQQELAQVQEEDAVQRLSERNVVQLVIKLMEQDSIDLIYTFTGKEYLTRKQAEDEIVDEIHVNGGRVRLDEISASLKIDLGVVQGIVKSVVEKEKDSMLLLSSIEIVTSWFLDNCAKVWNETLQEVGSITVGTLATQTALPVDVIQQAVKQRLGSIIQASFDKGVLYTQAFVRRQRAIVRGAFSAATQPTSLATVAGRCGLNGDTVETLLRQLIDEGTVQGRLTGGEFVPQTFARLQRSNVDTFFRDNGVLELRQAKAMKVANPFKFVRESFPDAIKLDATIVSKDIVTALEASLEECSRNGSFLNAKTLLPTQMTDKDCVTLLSKIPILKSKGKSKKLNTLKVFQGHIVVSAALIQKMSESLKSHVEKSAKAAATRKQSTPPKAAPPPKRAAGKKKKKGRRKKGDVSDEDIDTGTAPASSASPLDIAQRDFVASVQEPKNWAATSLTKTHAFLEEHDGLVEEIIETIIPTLRTWFSETFTTTQSSLQRGGALKTRKVQQDLEKLLEENYPIFQVYIKGLEMLRKRKEEENILAETVEEIEGLLVQPYCLRFLGAMVHYLCTLNNIDFQPEAEAASGETPAALFTNVQHCKEKAKELSPQVQKQVTVLYALADRRKLDVVEFNEKLAVFGVDECSLLMRKIDKKLERSVIFGRRQALLAELKPCKKTSRILTLILALVLQQCEGLVLPIPAPDEDKQQLHVFLPMVSKILPGDAPQWLAALRKASGVEESTEGEAGEEVCSEITNLKEMVALKDPRKYSVLE